MHRRTLLQLAALGPMGWLLRALADDSTTMTTGVRQLKGSATINGQAAHVGSPVNDGDVVETGPDSQIIYVIDRDAFLQRANSRVEVGGSSLKRILRLTTGALLGVFGKGNKTLYTSTATIGIRGTGCYLESQADRSYVCLCYGGAELIPTAAPEKAIAYQSKHHDTPYWVLDSGEFVQPAKMINHTDAELELLEGLVGRVPAFERDGGYYGRRY